MSLRLRRALVMAAVVGVVTAGCGGDSTQQPDDSQAPGTSAPSSTSAAPQTTSTGPGEQPTTTLGAAPVPFFLAGSEAPPGHTIEQLLAPSYVSPLGIAVSSTGAIVMTDHSGRGIYQVHEDGSISDYVAPGLVSSAAGIVFDPDDNLYVAGGDGLFRVSPDGVATRVADGVHYYQLAMGPAGDIYAVGPATSDVQRITPDGEVSTFAAGFVQANAVAVHPVTGEVFVADWTLEAIFQAHPDGSIAEFSPGPPGPRNTYLAFSDDGVLYANTDDGYLSVVGADGTRRVVSGFEGQECGLHHHAIGVDRQGRVLNTGFTDNHFSRFDPATGTIEVLVRNMTNTPALAMAPDGSGVYLGHTHPLCNGAGTISRLDPDGTLTVVVEGLPNSVSSLALDTPGTGYAVAGFQLLRFGTDGTIEMLATDMGGPRDQSLAVHPDTGVLWGADSEGVWYLDDDERRIGYPFPFEQTHRSPHLVFTADGMGYLNACSGSDLGLWRFDPADGSYALVYDIEREPGLGCSFGSVTTTADGNIYWYIDEVLRITPDGEASPFGVIWGDSQAVAGDPTSTDLYFTSSIGVLRIAEA